MQQFLATSNDEVNIGDLDNPETREFICYLQQVQPDLLGQPRIAVNQALPAVVSGSGAASTKHASTK